MVEQQAKIGIISCSGEELCEGTISRLATRRVLESLRSSQTVTICLPLFLAGDQQERQFARTHPVIAVDGCDKACAKRGTEMHSGAVSGALVVTEILEKAGAKASGATASRQMTAADADAIEIVAEQIAAQVDRLLPEFAGALAASYDPSAGECACERSLPVSQIEAVGRTISIPGLPLIFERFAKIGLSAGDASGPRLLQAANNYGAIKPEEEAEAQAALLVAYRSYCEQRS
jgi:uncharacterized metal-binding protein